MEYCITPFFSNIGGNGESFAVYRRKRAYEEQKGNRHIFKIPGYSPLQTSLDFTPVIRRK